MQPQKALVVQVAVLELRQAVPPQAAAAAVEQQAKARRRAKGGTATL